MVPLNSVINEALMDIALRGIRAAVSIVLAASLLAACGDDTSTPVHTTEPEDAGQNNGLPDTGGGDNNGIEPDAGSPPVEYPDVGFPPLPTAVETTVVSPVRAGDALSVTCRLLDEDGNVVEAEPAPEFAVAVAPDGSFSRQGFDWIATRVGTATVRCSAAELGLVDLEPETVEIIPGPVHTSVIEVDKTQMVAGDTVTATCAFYDEFGNEVDPAADGLTPELAVTPSGAGVDVQGMTATITAAEIYTMSCFLPSLTNEQSVAVEVVPDLPATMVVSAAPNQPVYGIGQVVAVNYIVTDQYGNVIPDARVTYTVSPATGSTSFGTGRYRFDLEGTYTVTVTVDGPTQAGMSISRSVTIVVNSEGPAIKCDDPIDGSMVDHVPGQSLTFRGIVTDAAGVQTLLVNGQGVAVGADGAFAADITPTWGINFVELVATDQFGEENSRTCAFLVSSNWSDPTTYMDDSVILKLRQPAVDDGNSTDLDSLDDLLHRVVNSQGLVDEVDAALEAANPLQPFTCESETCTFLGCICWFGWGVSYLGEISVGGPNTTELTLISGGVRARARIEDLGVKVRVPYRVTGISGSTEGWVTTDYIDVQLDIDLQLVNNQPRASIRPGSVIVSVGSISTSFNGLDGAIVNLVIDLFNNEVRGLIADTIRGFIEDSFGDVIDGVVSSLDIDTLGTTFNVPRLDGSGTIGVRFNLQFSRLVASSTRFAIGIGTRFLPSSTLNPSPSLGVPREHASVWFEPSTIYPVIVAVYVGVLNHVLHALWRGGLFDATVTGTDLGGGLPATAQAVIQTSLPPVVENLADGTVKLSLGGMRAAITYPGFFDDPLDVSLGARASSTVSIQGDDLVFGGITIDELVFSTNDVSLDATTRGVLEGFLRDLIQSIVDTSLNQSLPALPIPAFTIPASLSTYGLPGGSELGITGPSLNITDRHYELEGNFGVR